MDVPYLTGRCSLQPRPLPALAAARVGLGKAQCRAPAHLHPLLWPEKESSALPSFVCHLLSGEKTPFEGRHKTPK